MKKQLWTILLLSQSILAIGCGHSNISNEATIHSTPETTTVLPQTSTDTSFKNTSGDKACRSERTGRDPHGKEGRARSGRKRT